MINFDDIIIGTFNNVNSDYQFPAYRRIAGNSTESL